MSGYSVLDFNYWPAAPSWDFEKCAARLSPDEFIATLDIPDISPENKIVYWIETDDDSDSRSRGARENNASNDGINFYALYCSAPLANAATPIRNYLPQIIRYFVSVNFADFHCSITFEI